MFFFVFFESIFFRISRIPTTAESKVAISVVTTVAMMRSLAEPIVERYILTIAS